MLRCCARKVVPLSPRRTGTASGASELDFGDRTRGQNARIHRHIRTGSNCGDGDRPHAEAREAMPPPFEQPVALFASFR